MKRPIILYVSRDIIYALASCQTTANAVHARDCISRRIVATAAMHGVYSSTNTRKEYALAGVNMPLKAWRTTSPPAEAEKLANMESELTTASFATTPVSSATLACHDPKPSG